MIRIGPAAAPRWFDQRMDRFESYLDHLVAHGAGSIEFVVHGGTPGGETERVHLCQPNWAPAIAAAHDHGLEVHLHAPLTPEYRLTRWITERAELKRAYEPIVNLLRRIEANQERPPVLVVHGASIEVSPARSEEDTTREYIAWLVSQFVRQGSQARIAIELRSPVNSADLRFDRSISSLSRFAVALDFPQVGICWDIANYLAVADRVRNPTIDDLAHVNHVHLHDRRGEGGGLHAPLGDEGLPWATPLRHLGESGWTGAITLEIRYRYALKLGDPWTVLGDSLNHVHRVLKQE